MGKKKSYAVSYDAKGDKGWKRYEVPSTAKSKRGAISETKKTLGVKSKKYSARELKG
jgi:hypothetical protein